MPTALPKSKISTPSNGKDSHQSHSAVINRLKRADGHLKKIVTMVEEGRDCNDIAQQMHAVIRALENAKTVLIHDHLSHCLEQVVGQADREQRETISQFKEITKYL
ncbi:MAG: metal-sensing transcriptional repressor [Pseudomonadota bacterium]|nr:metal-sensing transcriptional repressor [Pseudomonadota bacterium]